MSKLQVEIILQDELNESAAAWFAGLRIEKTENGSTQLAGEIIDHPALHGLLERIRDLNLHLVSVQVRTLSREGKP